LTGETCEIVRACYEDAAAKALERRQAVAPSLDHPDLANDTFGVAIPHRIVEVGEELFARAVSRRARSTPEPALSLG
jgi:hypothetical protein